MLKIQEMLHICSESYKTEEGEEGEGEGGKAGDADSKAAAGKGKDAKDKPEGWQEKTNS